MTDLVQELGWADQEYGASSLFRRAADEIKRLRAEVEQLKRGTNRPPPPNCGAGRG